MTVILCGPSILGEMCVGCGGWVHAVVRGGFEHKGWRYCDPECIADFEDAQVRRHLDSHVGMRDLLCACTEFCAPRGLPTAAMRQEYEDGVAADRAQNPHLYPETS